MRRDYSRLPQYRQGWKGASFLATFAAQHASAGQIVAFLQVGQMKRLFRGARSRWDSAAFCTLPQLGHKTAATDARFPHRLSRTRIGLSATNYF
jgi:hypothetical protein